MSKSKLIFRIHTKVTSLAPSSPEHNVVASTVSSGREHTNGLMHNWLGPVIVSALLLIVGVLMLVTHWRKHTTRVIFVADSSELGQLSVRRTHSEVSRKELESSNSHRPILTAHINECRRTCTSKISDVERNQGRLQTLFAESDRLRNRFVENKPFLTLLKASTAMQTRDNAKCDNSANIRCSFEQENRNSSMGRAVGGNRLVNQLTRIKRDKNINRGDNIIGAQSQDQNILRSEHFGLKLLDGLYSNNDGDAISVFSNLSDKVTEKHSSDTGRSAEQVLYDYARSVQMCYVERVDVLENDDSYITPVSCLTRPFEMLQKKETDVLGTADIYITPSNDFVSHIEMCQGEGIDINEADSAYITPI